MKKYSDWFKVDLHIHTDFSKKTKTNDYQGNFDINILKQKLINNSVKLFSLTDHNIINVEAYKEYYNNNSENDPKLLIGCEFDIIVPESGTDKTYHSLIIFENDTFGDVEIISSKIENLYTQNGLAFLNRVITIDEIYDLFNGFNYFFIPHAGNTKSILDPYRNFDMKLCQQMVLLMQSAFEKVREATRQKYNEGFDKLKSLDFQAKDDIAYINFSDNHNCASYPCTNKDGENHKFYCIKGKPSFESLRFAFIDPVSRIKKFEEVEQLKSFNSYIQDIKVSGNETITDNIIEFSPNLNVIVGGRSSGKSLLFNIIGNKLNTPKHDLKKYNLSTNGIKIKTSLDSDYKDSIKINNHEIIYINQGDIVNYFENNSLFDLINESGKGEDYKKAKEFFTEKKLAFIENIKTLIDKYSDLRNSLISNFTIHNKDINSVLSVSYFFKQIENLQDKSNSFIDSDDTLKQLEIFTEKFIKDKNWSLTSDELKIVSDFQLLVSQKKSDYDKFKNLYSDKGSFINDANSIITTQNSKLDNDGKEKDTSNQRILLLKNNIALIIEKAKELEEICLEIESYRYNFKKEIIINEDVNVVLEVEEKENIKDKILDGINGIVIEESLYKNILGLIYDEKRIKHLPDNSAENFRKKINTQLKSVLEYYEKPIEFLNYHEGGSSKNNSPGFNSEKYLDTILRNGNSKIVLIDQPEDNLGNKFIIDKLINLIRQIKFQKQIILVTHNPSVVVYGDAENIILAQNDNNKISYKQLVLEDKESQKQICQVLDGGQYIFDQRAKKYNIEKLLKEIMP
jgi:predicted ATPase